VAWPPAVITADVVVAFSEGFAMALSSRSFVEIKPISHSIFKLQVPASFSLQFLRILDTFKRASALK